MQRVESVVCAALVSHLISQGLVQKITVEAPWVGCRRGPRFKLLNEDGGGPVLEVPEDIYATLPKETVIF